MCSSLVGSRKVTPHTIEISTLGFISNVSDFVREVKIQIMPIAVKQSIVRSVLNCSFDIIYCNRNSSVIASDLA